MLCHLKAIRQQSGERETERERERETDRQRGGKDERKTGKRREESIPSLESLLVRQPAAAAALSLVL